MTTTQFPEREVFPPLREDVKAWAATRDALTPEADTAMHASVVRTVDLARIAEKLREAS